MDVKAFPALIVGVVVALVLAGAVLPVFAETTSATDTFINDGYFRMTKANSTSSAVISWDHLNPTVLTVNDIDMNMSNLPVGVPLTIYASEEAIVRYTFNSASDVSVNRYGLGYQNATVDNGKDVTITLTENGVNMIWGTNSVDGTATGVYYIDPNGAYTMKKSDAVANVDINDSVLVLAGTTNISGAVTLYGSGTIDDGINISVVAGISEGDTYEIGDVTINYTLNSAYKDLASLTSIVFPFTKNSTTTTITYSYFVVPYEITAEKAVHPDGPLTVILNVLPLLAIAGLVTGAVVWFINRKG